jgi:hypothetical protein
MRYQPFLWVLPQYLSPLESDLRHKELLASNRANAIVMTLEYTPWPYWAVYMCISNREWCESRCACGKFSYWLLRPIRARHLANAGFSFQTIIKGLRKEAMATQKPIDNWAVLNSNWILEAQRYFVGTISNIHYSRWWNIHPSLGGATENISWLLASNPNLRFAYISN